MASSIYKLKKAHAAYLKLGTREASLQLVTAYNQGSLAFVIESAATSIENAILSSRASDSATCPEEVYSTVAMRCADIFASIRATALFPPDFPDTEDDVSFSHAESKQKSARLEYKAAVITAYQVLDEAGVHDDPDMGSSYSASSFR
ncbi:unnamed protein product [Phytophthora fragariaefolia]|uniref:Unnamed protein product n=1 Tax=Phytophthora fragariaefolia TaxID=1490495 RepID=A0A9W6Y5S8_9STRA|nr:unnamed protein product [Phytophthora fragariaefolia]